MSAIVVTGAASGIGRAVVKELAEAARTVLAIDIAEAGLHEMAGPAVRTCAFDLQDNDALSHAIEGAGPLSAIVHCAALFPQLSLAQSELDDLDHVFGVNFRAAFALTKLACIHMPAGGSIVLLTSGAGLMEVAQDPFQRPFALYGASKAALDQVADGVAAELAQNGIVLTTITPGAFVRTLGTSAINSASMAEIAVEDVAKAVVWLVSEPRHLFAGRRLSAVTFGSDWG